MSLLEELKKKLADIDVKDLSIPVGIAKARSEGAKIIETFMKDHDLWPLIKEDPPGKYYIVSNLPGDSDIRMHLSDHLIAILKKRSER